jgi:hypothetical protein
MVEFRGSLHYEQVILTDQNKTILKRLIIDEAIEEDFHSLEIKSNEKLLFKGYDGMEYGTISKTLPLTNSFIKNFIETEMCFVSDDW